MAELLSVPVKKSSDVDVIKPLRNLLQATYGAEGQECAEALQEFARMRSNAIWKVFDNSSLDTIYSYYDQLVSLESKVPPQEVQIPFKWKDAFDKGSIFGGRMSLTVSSLSFERVCVLFNMAALQSTLAAQQPLDSEDSLKLAAKLLQQAAGIFSYLKGNVLAAVHADTTPDLHPDTLQALSHLMLAQAQEVIAYKCIRDEMKESMVARVCAACEEMYSDAARGLQREPLRSMADRDWPAHLQAKQAAFRGLTQYYQSMACRAAGAVGEEIARLTLAVEQLRAAGGKLGGAALLQESLARAQRRLAEAQRDNDFIYHERVPEPAQLEAPGRAAVAKPLPLPERWSEAPRDLFGALVPLQVHQALQASAARRNDLVTAEITKLREATQLLNGVLASLNLPACLEGGGGGELPDSIRAKAAAVRDAGGLAELERLAAELPDLLQRNREILDEAERMLREEAEADAALRAQFGARWSRTESAKLTESFRANAAKYAQIISNAVSADATVKQKLEQHRAGIALLSGAEGELRAGVPAAPSHQGTDADALDTLRRLMREVEALKAERDDIETELKNAKVDLRERFLAALAADGGIDEPAISTEALGAALGGLQRRAADTLQRQDALLAQVRQAHAALLAARGGSTSRDHALAQLAAAHDAYQDLTGNLKEGVKFYNDLTQLLVAFQNKVGDFCFARKTEKEELLKDLTQAASRPAPAPPAPPAPHQPPAQPQQPATSAPQLPYPVQPQGMPVPYAAGAVPYPYYAPLPALYNPYATLPFPHHARGPAPHQQYGAPQYQQYPQYPQYRPQ